MLGARERPHHLDQVRLGCARVRQVQALQRRRGTPTRFQQPTVDTHASGGIYALCAVSASLS